MEPAGLAIGIAGLTALLSSCVEAYDRIEKFRSYDVVSFQLQNRLENQKYFLKNWGERVGLNGADAQGKHHPALDDETILIRVRNTLASIQKPLQSLNRDSHGASGAELLAEPPLSRRSRFWRKIGWALGEKERWIEQIEYLELTVKVLDDLVPVATKRRSELYSHDAVQKSRPKKSMISPADRDVYLIDKIAQNPDSYRSAAKTWLDASSSSATRAKLQSARTQDTCTWILECREYQKWLQASSTDLESHTLWLHGPPGFGKSVLSAFLVDHHESTRSENVFYFFCSASDSPSTYPTMILRSCLTQALSDVHHLRQVVDFAERSDGKIATPKDLWNVFNAIVQLGHPFTMIIDGFDECLEVESEADRRLGATRSRFLEALRCSFDQTASRLLVLSRDESDIRLSLGSSESNCKPAIEYSISITDVKADIQRFAESEVQLRLRQNLIAQQDALAHQLAKKSSGMFLWIKLQVAILRPGRNAVQLRRDIVDLPPGLEGVYETDWQRIMSSISSEKSRKLNLLRWVTSAIWPLTVQQLSEVLNVIELLSDSEPGLALSGEDMAADMLDQESISEELLRLCHSFLEISQFEGTPGSAKIEIRHFTARSFLAKKFGRSEKLDVERYGDNVLAAMCLQYIMQPACWGSPGQVESETSTSFRSYAVANWPKHASPLLSGYDDVQRLAHKFFENDNQEWLKWRTSYQEQYEKDLPDLAKEDLERYPELRTFQPGSRIYYAALLGLEWLLQSASSEVSRHANEGAGMYGSPLQAACAGNNLKCIEFLLAAGADVNSEGGIHGSALNAASYHGSGPVISTLLQAGAATMLRDKWNRHALYIAAYRGHVDIMDMLIAAGAAVNEPNSFGHTPLLVAADEGHEQVVEKLIQNGANFSATDKEGESALFCAAQAGHDKIVRLLLSSGASVRLSNNRGDTPLDVACRYDHYNIMSTLLDYEPKISASSDDKVTFTGAAVETKGVDQSGLSGSTNNVLDSRDSMGRTPLMQICYTDDKDMTEEIIRKLLQKGASTSVADERGDTALHLACWKGKDSVVSALLEHGADISARPFYGLTALHIACENDHVRVVKILLENGADIAAAAYNGYTALHFGSTNGYNAVVRILLEHGAVVSGRGFDGRTALHLACYKGNGDIILDLLKHGAEVSATDLVGYTPLHIACEQGNEALVPILLDTGADVSGMDITGSTPLHLACRQGWDKVVSILLQRGADTTAGDRQSSTPLHDAALEGHETIVRDLIDHGAPIDAVETRTRHTALSKAVIGRHLGIVEILHRSGANVNHRDSYGYTPISLSVWSRSLDILTYFVENAGADSGILFMMRKLPLHDAALKSEDIKEIVKYLKRVNGEKARSKDINEMNGVLSSFSLYQAAQYGDLDMVKALTIESPASVHSRNPENGMTPTHCAAKSGETDTLSFLLNQGGMNYVNDPVENDCILLHYAARAGSTEMTELLLKHETQRIDLKNRLGCTPFSDAASGGHTEVMRILADNGADINTKSHTNFSPIHLAASGGFLDAVTYLLEKGANADTTSNHGTPLQLAAWGLHTEVSHLLTTYGHKTDAS